MNKNLFFTAMICFLLTHLFAAPFYHSPVSVKVDTGNTPTATVCKAPHVDVLPSSSGATASVRWSLDTIASVYQVEYHVANDTAWSAPIQVNVARKDSNFTVLKNLATCTKYEVRVRKMCSDTQFSIWTKYVFVSGNCPPPCYQPINLNISYNDTSASIKWATYNTNDSIFIVEWKKSADTVWQSSTVKNIKSFSFKGLQACTIYNIRIKTNCSTTSMSAYSVKEFKTTGCITTCPVPTQLYYSTSGEKTSISWTSTNANKHELQYRIAPDTIWMATVISSKNFFTIPASTTCDKYQVRVRSLCSSTERVTYMPSSAWSNILNFTTQGCTIQCAAPSRMNVSTTSTSAYISWDSTQDNNVKIYSLDWTPLADTSKHTLVTGITKISSILNNLMQSTGYHVRIRVQCPNGNQGLWSPFLNFKTTVPVPLCFKPLQYNVQVQDTSAKFSWSNVTGASGKIILWIVSSDSTFNKTFSLTGSSATIILPSCKKFTARFKTQCNDTLSSDFTEALNFKTGACPLPCAKVYALTVLKTDSSTATIAWAASTATKYYVEYKLATDNAAGTIWKRDSTTANNFTIKGLTACKNYNARVFAVCASGVSESSNVIYFQTLCQAPNCIKPTNLQIVSIDTASATISWAGTTIGKFYVDYYLIDKNGGTTTTPTPVVKRDTSSTSSITLKNLSRCKTYGVKIYAICADNILSEATFISLITKGCTTVLPTTCNAPENIQTLVSQDTVINISWSTITGASRYEVRLSKTSDSTVTPIVYVAAQPKIIISGLKICTYYSVAVRTICGTTPNKWSVPASFATGRCSRNTCQTPTVSVLQTDSTSASITISNTGAIKYYFAYREAADSLSTTTGWKYDSTVNLSKTISGLLPCHTYLLQAASGCGYAVSESSIPVKFSTLCSVNNPVTLSCAVPINLVLTLTDTVGVFSWTGGIDSVTNYNIRIHNISGDTTWFTFDSPQPSTQISGLARCQTYQWQVRKVCSKVPGDWSATSTFSTTIGCGPLVNNIAALATANIILLDFSVSPNPSSDYMEVGYTLKRKATLSIDIFNWQGQVINRRNLGEQDPAYYVQKYDDVSNLPTGLYLISVNANGGVLTSQKWLKIE